VLWVGSLVMLAPPGWPLAGKGFSVMTLPTRTPEQRQQALRKAVAARTARKQLLEAIARGQLTIPAVLERAKSDPVVGKTRVAALLKSLPGYGPVKVTALMQQTGIVASRRAAGLSEQQRRRLCDALG
jgi:S13-like H2TH domain